MNRVGHSTVAAAVAAAFATASLAGCSSITGSPDPSFMNATVAGGLDQEFHGDGMFMIRPSTTPGPLFTLGSTGRGSSANQRFTFHTLQTPQPGDYAIAAAAGVTAGYSIREGDVVRLFTADSGTLRINQSTAARIGARLSGSVSGTFEASLTLTDVCEVIPGFPGEILRCDKAEQVIGLEVAGAFLAGPTGGDSPALQLSPR